jgi:hypothetical protein
MMVDPSSPSLAIDSNSNLIKTKYSMKRIILTSLAALALLATPQARAWTYTDGDLLLVFRASGHKDIEFDLGSITSLLNKTNGYATAITGWETGLVTTEFGTDLTGVKVVLLATGGATNWLSSAEPNTTAYNVSSQESDILHGVISAVGTKPLYPINIPVAGANAYAIDPGGQYAASSYDNVVKGGGNASGIPKLGGNAPFTVEQAIPGLLDFWQVEPTAIYPNSPPDKLIGTFTITSDGVLTFVAGPRAAVITTMTRTDNVSAVQFTTTVGNQYALSFTNALGGPVSNWPVDNGIVIGNGKLNTINRTNVDDTEFYRVNTQ